MYMFLGGKSKIFGESKYIRNKIIFKDLSLYRKLSEFIASHYSVGARNYARSLKIDDIRRKSTFLSGEIPQFFQSDIEDGYTPQ